MELTPIEDAVQNLNGFEPAPNAPPPPGALSRAIGGMDDVTARAAQDITTPGFGERFGASMRAGFQRAWENDMPFGISDDFVTARQLDPVIEAINRDKAPEDQLSNPYAMGMSPSSRAALQRAGLPQTSEGLEQLVWQRRAALGEIDPTASANLPKDHNELMANVQAEQRASIGYSNLLSKDNGPVSGPLATFAGGMGAEALDPLNIAATVVGFPAAEGILKTALIEGAGNVALDAAGMPGRAKHYQDIGEPMTTGDMVEEMAASGLMGAGIGAGGKALARMLGLSGHALADEFAAANPDPSPTLRTAEAMVRDDANRADDNPYAGGAPGQDFHRQAILDTSSALDGGTGPLPQHDALVERAADLPLQQALQKAGFAIENFDPKDIGFDPANFQFKRGGDERGVTDRLSGVTQWDPVKAGLALIYEKNDGSLVAADGHQRLGLAQGLAAQDPDIRINGFRLREKDGITPQTARVIAALKNIAEGTGDGLDAARVLRDAPEGVKELPPRSPLVRRAKDLLNLGDDAWGMAWNGAASERDAAIVGRLVGDHRMQTAILGHLAKDSPETAEEAELFVRQALAAGAEHHVQADMFGDFLKSDLIFPERARILKATLTTLRKDKALFKTLTSRENEIADAGNVLNAAENAKRGDTANRAFGVLKALAERKGPISDALQAAAEKSLKGNRRGAAKDFLAAVRRGVDEGELDRPLDGGDVGALEPEATQVAEHLERARSQDPENLGRYSDPIKKPEALRQQTDDLARELAPAPEKKAADEKGAGGLDQTVLDGMEPSARQLAAAREGRLKGEAHQEDAGGMFAPRLEETRDMFGPAKPAIDALARMDQAERIPDLFGDGETTIKSERAEIERQARAVERLRSCVEGGEG